MTSARVPDAVVRCVDPTGFREDPLHYLLRARALGDLVVLSEDLPLFSRAAECNGSLAVFGPVLCRQVLSDVDTFGMPVSVTERHALPPVLSNLNSGLFSMHGERHRERQRMLAPLLSAASATAHRPALELACRAYFESWQLGASVRLVSELRRFALFVAESLLFGSIDGAERIGTVIQHYFQLRRAYSTVPPAAQPAARAALIESGVRTDAALRERVRRFAEDTALRESCVLGRLSQLSVAKGERLGEDELVAHGNVLFMSSSEPVAMAMAWALLLLSQLPRLRQALRQELAAARIEGALPSAAQLDALPLLHGVVQETLRLLPPSAMLVRLSRGPSVLAGYELPTQCELVMSPWVAQRDPIVFPDSNRFRPERWRTSRPTPFEYFPFGAGLRACLGRQLADHTIKLGLVQILTRFDLTLVSDEVVDWRMNVTFMPAIDPLMSMCDPHAVGRVTGRLLGPVAQMVSWED